MQLTGVADRRGDRGRPTARPAGAGGRRDDRAAALAGRRALHLPRLPRVRAPDRGGRPRRPAASPCRAAGWASCAPTRRRSGDAGRLPREVRSRARQRQLLVVTKANSRSTVHRPAYLDYVGVKTFDEAGDVIGERRFLGLFTSAAYNESIQRIPVLRRKAAEVLARSGFSSNSHSGKDLLQILETYPRDELFQIGSDDLAATALSVMHLQERRQLRLFLRRDDYGRFMSCMVYLPRDRYTTQVRQAMEEILLDGVRRCRASTTPRWSPSRCWPGCTSSSGSTRTTAVPDVDPAQVEAELVLATRSWDDDFARRAARQLRPRGGGPARQHLRRRVPRGLQGGPAGRRRGRRPAPAGGSCTTDGDIDLQLYLPAGRRAGRPPAQAVPRRRAGLAVPGAAGPAGHGRRGRRRAALRDRPVRPPGRLGLRLRAALRAVRRAARRRRPDPVPGRVRRRLGGRGRERRLQRAGAAGRADLAAGDGAAGLRQVPAPGRQRRSASATSRSASPPTPTSPGCWWRCSRPGSTRPATRPAESAPRSSSTG